MKENRYSMLPRWLVIAAHCFLSVFLILGLAGCSKAATPAAQPQASQPAAAAPTEVAPPTATAQPSPTATQPPTATPEPSATPTLPPTATPLPALAVLADGFTAWCTPQGYAVTKPAGPDAPDYARKLTVKGDTFSVPIPASFCVLAYRFNQPAPQGATLTFFDGKSPFLKLPLQAVDGHPEEVWAMVNHTYVINPPLWFVNYRLAVTSADGKELWSNPVTFTKPLPNECPYGGLPDPVTLWCTPTDPWEIEQHPDTVYPYKRTPNP